MKVKYIGRYAGVRVPDAGDVFVEQGETLEVSDSVGSTLLEQPSNWERVGGRSDKKAQKEEEESSE